MAASTKVVVREKPMDLESQEVGSITTSPDDWLGTGL